MIKLKLFLISNLPRFEDWSNRGPSILTDLAYNWNQWLYQTELELRGRLND